VTVPKLVDETLERRVIVFGSLPPQGRDLDLLARPEDARALVTFLGRNGFVERGGEWVRFRDCTADSVDIRSTDELRLPADELQVLFEEGREIPGFGRLVRPAPWHVLLLVAERVHAEGGALSAKRRRRVESALEEEPDAWAIANERAPTWNAVHALAALKLACKRGPSAAAEPRPGRKRPIVVAFSGVDGSGKTTQLDALRTALGRLGISAEREYVRIEWLTLTGNRILSAIAAPAKWLANVATRSPRRPSPDVSTEPYDAGRAMRERSALITHAWVLIVAIAHARVQRRATRKRESRVVICDRYTLDAVVWLRFHYGRRRSFRLQTFLLRALSRTPVRAYYLDVEPRAALGRKVEHFGLRELEVLRSLYREECERCGFTRLDGERSREELCAVIAQDVWDGLHGR